MISLKSLFNFFIVNGLLIFIGILQYYILIRYPFYNILFIIGRNLFLVNMSDFSTQNKDDIGERIKPIEEYQYEFLTSLISTSIIECITTSLFINFSLFILSIDFNYVQFVFYSFIFELIFDFFHYIGHYLLHKNKYLYNSFHAGHHKHQYPIAITAFYQHPIDLILTNSLPQLFALLLFPYFSLLYYSIILTYKTFIEISGHLGKDLGNASSFSQCIWLPKMFGIELRTIDHDFHHTHYKYNFSKRFSLWDKLFGTYKYQ